MTDAPTSPWRAGRTSDRFAGHVAAVTGAGGAGIGSAVVHRLASEGASILALEHHEGRLQTIVDSVTATHGVPIVGVTVDITDRRGVDAAIARASDELGVVDIVVNNAAINPQGSIFDYDPDTFDAVIDADLNAAWYLIRRTIGAMRDQGWGSIVNIGSIAAYNGGRGREPPYSAAKAALHEVTRSVALEGGPYGIRCNAIAPGLVRSKFVEKHRERFEADRLATPLRRHGHPDEIANVAAFLVSDESSFITGEVLTVSGGWYLRP
jgi:NAD(P)-dependent dehydrogenase (short-subunit alcohol dehydrogenase family)